MHCEIKSYSFKKWRNPAESWSWRGRQNGKLLKAQFKESEILDKGRWRESTFSFSLQCSPPLCDFFSFPVGKETSSLGISFQNTKGRTQWYSETHITEVQLQELPEFASTATWASSFFLKTGYSINFSATRKFSVFASMTFWSTILELLGTNLVDWVLMLLCVPELMIRRRFLGARLLPPCGFGIAHPQTGLGKVLFPARIMACFW